MDKNIKLNKLIRLTTEDTNCIFDGEFDEELFIEPNSEIALKSATIAFASSTVVIGLGAQSSDLIISHDDLEHRIEIPYGAYSPTNTPALLRELSRLLNGTMTLGVKPQETGLSYNIALNNNQRVEIQNLRAHPISITGEDYYSNGAGRYWDLVDTEVTVETSRFENDGILARKVSAGGSTATNYDALGYPDFSFTGGLGVWRTTISSLNPPVDPSEITGFEIGFVSKREVLKSNRMQETDVICGLRVTATLGGGVGSYQFKSSATGNYVDTFIPVGTRDNNNSNKLNDVIEWRSENDDRQGNRTHKLTCFVHRDGQPTQRVGEVERIGVYAADQYVGGFYSLYGQPTFNDLTETLYIPSFYNSPITGEEMKRFSNIQSRPTAGVHSLLPTLTALDYTTNIRFRMSTQSTQLKEQIMGFTKNLVENVPDTNTFYDITDIDLTFSSNDYVSDTTLRETIAEYPRDGVRGVESPSQSFIFFGSQNYIVELLNLPLNSYDSFSSKRGRSNILAVIPQNESNDGNIDNVLMYETSEMVYIGLTNKSELSLRNVRARITFPDYSTVQTVGLSSVVLHIRPMK